MKVEDKPALSFVLDCSITMCWCYEDEFDEYAKTVLNALDNGNALVPNLWNLEVVNVLAMSEKKNKLTPADSTRFIELLESLPIYNSDLIFTMNESVAAARTNNLTSYDATYLLLAMNQGLPLATKDKALINACVKNGVQLFMR